MQPFRRFAVFTLARDTSFVALAACTILVAVSVMPSLAFRIAATLVLIFSIALALRAVFLTEERFLHSEVWQVLEPEQRPSSRAAQDCAREDYRDLLLHFAKATAAIAIGLYLSGLLTDLGNDAEPGALAVVTAALN